MMNLHLCNKIFPLIKVYGVFLSYLCVVCGCITYVCGVCVVSVFFVSCHMIS